MNEKQIFELVLDELARAREIHPHWPSDIVHACSVAMEESGEVIKEVNQYYWGDKSTKVDIREETIQALAMWFRFLVDTPEMNS